MPLCLGLVDTGRLILPLFLPLVAFETVGTVGLFKFPFLLVVVGGLGVVLLLLEDDRLIGLLNLNRGFVDLLEDSVVVCRGDVTVSPPSTSSV